MRHREDHGAADARSVAGLLFLLGWGSLVLQVGWMREFRLVFGATTAASAAVVAIFMGGTLPAAVRAVTRPRDGSRRAAAMLYAMNTLGAVMTTRKRYDLIVSEPSNPYHAGVASPFTREFYSIVRRNLESSGLFVQWLQAYEVDEQTGFSVEAMATAARQLGAGRAPVEGPIHEPLVENHRQVLRALWHGDLAPGTGSRLDQTSREQFLRAYANADTRRMLQVWEATRYEPVFPSEVTLLALAYADSADDRAVPLIERLRSPYPVEAGAIEAHLRWRQGDVAAAAELLGRVFLMLREHPWGMSHVIELCFLAAEDVSRQDPRHAATLFAALSQPFAVHAYDHERLTAVHGVAYSLHVAAVVQTIEALEPWVPWSERFLVARHEAYRTTDHRLTSRARRDLDSFRRAARPVNRPSIALQFP